MIHPSSRKQQSLWQLQMSLEKEWIYLPVKETLLEKAVSAANRTPAEHDHKEQSIFALSHWGDPQLQPDGNPHLGNLKSPPVFFGCLCDTLQWLSTEFRTFIYSGGYTWSFARFNLFSLSNRLPRILWAVQFTVLSYSCFFFSVLRHLCLIHDVLSCKCSACLYCNKRGNH